MSQKSIKLSTEYGDLLVARSTTVGAVTINAIAGQCNLAAAATTVTVTNSQCRSDSLILATLATADANATVIKSAVAGSGSFVITVVTAPAANVAINFLIIN